MRLIDADALGAHMFHGYGTEITPVDIDAETYKLGWNDAIEAIMDNAPTVEPERKKGEWKPVVLTSYPAKYREMCSCCGFMKNKEAFRFCPICGAEMKGDIDD